MVALLKMNDKDAKKSFNTNKFLQGKIDYYVRDTLYPLLMGKTLPV